MHDALCNRILRKGALALSTLALAACGSGKGTTGSHASENADSGINDGTDGGGNSSADSAAGGSNAGSLILALGDGKVSTMPRNGYVYSCTQTFHGGGAMLAGDWIDAAAGTWTPGAKPTVQGSVDWPQASNSFSINGDTRTITSNDLPKGLPTGNFPVAASDPAYQYDRNPNSIRAQTLNFSMPVTPSAATSPVCLGLGPIGITTVGVVFFNALDAEGRDAAAHEIQDLCDGHPEMSGAYHYHSISQCLIDQTQGPSTLVGYAFDGYGIYVEHDGSGNLLTNADLDECHGRTSAVDWDGTSTMMFHYVVTREYPYTLGCFHGTPVLANLMP